MSEEPTSSLETVAAPDVVPSSDAEVEAAFRRRSRRAFLTWGAGLTTGVVGWNWLTRRSKDDGLYWPIRRSMDAQAALSRTLSRDAGVATFARSEQEPLRVNGRKGIDSDLAPGPWDITVTRNGAPLTKIPLDDLRALPQFTQTVLHKCIEGWSATVTWSGPRLGDAMRLIASRTDAEATPWVGFATPDRGYYVSLDWDSAMLPQALLATSLNGEPLTPEHGAPIRLALPTHYGVKSLKRLASIDLSSTEPPDYWGQRGYDRGMRF